MLPEEPIITVNGQVLTNAQAMTVRVALGSFGMDLSKPDALGTDACGRAIAEGYRRAINEIYQMFAIGP